LPEDSISTASNKLIARWCDATASGPAAPVAGAPPETAAEAAVGLEGETTVPAAAAAAAALAAVRGDECIGSAAAAAAAATAGASAKDEL